MFQSIIKLLKNIQFWTILGTIATIVSTFLIFYHPKQSDLKVFVSAESRLLGPISNDLNYDFNKSDTIAIFYLMPILEEIDHTCYYIVDLPISLISNSNKPVRNVVISTKNTVPDYNVLNNPIIDNYSGALDIFFNNSYKYPRLFVNNNKENLVRDYDKSTTFVDFYDYIPSHAHISIPLRLVFYTPTNIRNKIVDSFSFDLVIGEEDYENKQIPFKVFGFLCNLREYNANHDLDIETFRQISSKYNTVIYVNTLLEKCKDINEDYWIEQRGEHLVSYINSSIGSFHVFNVDKLKSTNTDFQFSIPKFSNFETWFEIALAIFLSLFATFSWIPNLRTYYSFKKKHSNCNKEFWFKFSGSEINNDFWLYAFWTFSVIAYPIIVMLLLDLFSNVSIL